MSKVDKRAALQAERAAAWRSTSRICCPLKGDERVLDVGAGTGALRVCGRAARSRGGRARGRTGTSAARAKADAPANVEVVVGDGEHLPFDDFSFDVAATLRTLHHTHRPELLVAELARVTKPGGTILVVDQLAPIEPLAAIELNTFRARARPLDDASACGRRPARAVRREQPRAAPSGGRSANRGTSRRTSTSPAARARSASTRATSRLSGYEAVVGWYVLAR